MAQDFFAPTYFQGANDCAPLFLAGALIFCAAFFFCVRFIHASEYDFLSD